MCGVVGIIGTDKASAQALEVLSLLQHRGQDSAGLLTYGPREERFLIKKALGQVAQVFKNIDLKDYPGILAIGHTRYSTVGKIKEADLQPLFFTHPVGIALVQNGNVSNYQELKNKLLAQGRSFSTDNDLEVILHIMAESFHERGNHHQMSNSLEALEAAALNVLSTVQGGYALVGALGGLGLFALRDPLGIRPLFLGEKNGEKNNEFALASETASLSFLGYENISEVNPGELIWIEKEAHEQNSHEFKLHRISLLNKFEKNKTETNKTETNKTETKTPRPCLFEMIYFSGADSLYMNKSVYQSRVALGHLLGLRIKNQFDQPGEHFDVVMPVPDTSRSGALGVAEALHLPYREGLLKNRYVQRSFIQNSTKERESAVGLKFSVITELVKDQHILLVDDSLVRGTTAKKIIALLMSKGAASVSLALTCPPIKHPCFYGIDFSTYKELVAAQKMVNQIAKVVGAKHLIYTEIEDLEAVFETPHFCKSCLTGDYPYPTPTPVVKHLRSGSVKDIYEVSEKNHQPLLENQASNNSKNFTVFQFTDRYSVFDWGEMPNNIHGKGQAQASIAKDLFALLDTQQIKHHLLLPKELGSYELKPTEIAVQTVKVPSLIESKDIYKSATEDILVPLECLFRFGVARGSSLKKRLGSDENKWKLAGFDRVYSEGEFFLNHPYIEFSTKLEAQDRLLSEIEAQELAGASDSEWITIKETVSKVAKTFFIFFKSIEIELWDGKIELAYGKYQETSGTPKQQQQQREIIVVDSVGLDELRTTFKGLPLSKELLRQYYLNTPWYEALELAKKMASNPNDFKTYCLETLKLLPSELDFKFLNCTEHIYELTSKLIKYEIENLVGDREHTEQKNLLSELEKNLTLAQSFFYQKDQHINQHINRVLLLGKGAREHAIALELSSYPNTQVFVYPGNPGMESVGMENADLENAGLENVKDYSPIALLVDEHQDTKVRLKNLHQQLQFDFAVFGPEDFIYSDYKNYLEGLGLAVLSPSHEVNFLEKSKILSKKLMSKYNIKTAEAHFFSTLEEALENIHALPTNWKGYVLKFSGPAAGKGVFVLDSKYALKTQLEELLSELGQSPLNKNHQQNNQQKNASFLLGLTEGLVIEEKLSGPECSFFYAVLGDEYHFLGEASDYKRLKDFDQGPNTGGMGAVSPVEWLTENEREEIHQHIFLKTLEALKKEGLKYQGFLFLGIMVDPTRGAHLLEYNVRFGDPETQAFLPRLCKEKEHHFFLVAKALAKNDLKAFKDAKLKILPSYATHVVKVSEGYPGTFSSLMKSGASIAKAPLYTEFREYFTTTNAANNAINEAVMVKSFFAQVSSAKNKLSDQDELLNEKGRVLGVTAVGSTRCSSRMRCYQELQQYSFEGEYFRKDIGHAPTSTHPWNVALMSSTTGSNVLSLLETEKKLLNNIDHQLLARFSLVIINNEHSSLIAQLKIKFPNIKTILVPKKIEPENLLHLLAEHHIDWIFLAGWMNILSPLITESYPLRIVNLHPSLLPLYPGLNALERSFKGKESTAGVTLHFVDRGLDTGPVIAQKSWDKSETKTLDDFKARGKKLEWDIYAEFFWTLTKTGKHYE